MPLEEPNLLRVGKGQRSKQKGGGVKLYKGGKRGARGKWEEEEGETERRKDRRKRRKQERAGNLSCSFELFFVCMCEENVILGKGVKDYYCK